MYICRVLHLRKSTNRFSSLKNELEMLKIIQNKIDDSIICKQTEYL